MKKILASTLILLAGLFLLSVSAAFAQPCEGNFDCDEDVDGSDAAVFKADFGRSPFKNPCPGCPPPAPVPKTGQTTSYYEGDDGGYEKGVAWPEPRFTENEDGTVTDNLTGLIWLRNANCFGPRIWEQALTDCNGLANGQCGLTDGSSGGDWRLPNRREIFSLIDDKYYEPALSNSAGTGQWTHGDPFTNLIPNAIYWSSTTYAGSSHAWFVAMSYGGVEGYYKGGTFYVWPVRGGQ